MTRRVKKYQPASKWASSSDYQLPSGQLWWMLRYSDGDRVTETLFTFEGEREQTWFYANRWAQLHLRELGLMPTEHYRVSLYAPPGAMVVMAGGGGGGSGRPKGVVITYV